ncbi:NAD(P)-dependent oxidoreductase [Neotabrizicola sp. VNH66]
MQASSTSSCRAVRVPWPQPLLLNRTACIAGLGAISRELAIRLLPFGMRLTGVSDGRAAAPGFDRIYPRRDIAVAASEADFLIVLTPYSARTHHLVDDTVLRAMRPDAVLLNLSRGGCIDEAALLRHLTEGHLRAAALDVFAQEPLPADSPVWSAPRLIVTPHVGGRSDIYHHQVLPGIRANLTAWLQDPDGLLPDLVMRPS